MSSHFICAKSEVSFGNSQAITDKTQERSGMGRDGDGICAQAAAEASEAAAGLQICQAGSGGCRSEHSNLNLQNARMEKQQNGTGREKCE